MDVEDMELHFLESQIKNKFFLMARLVQLWQRFSAHLGKILKKVLLKLSGVVITYTIVILFRNVIDGDALQTTFDILEYLA